MDMFYTLLTTGDMQMKSNRLFTACQHFLVVFILFISSVCHAAGQPSFDRIVFFGDSLSDNGNLYNTLDGFMPKSPPYFEGRFSNGTVWSELVAQHYQDNNVGFDDYAVGGETAILHNPVDGYLPFTITASLYDYLIRTMYTDRSNTLFVVWVGSNDYLPGVANADELSTHVISGIQSVIDSLIYHGAKHIIVMNLPDLSKTPYGAQSGFADQLSEAVKQHNAKLETMVTTFENSYKAVSIHLFDVNSLFISVVNSKMIADTTTSCWTGNYTLRQADKADILRNEFNQYMRTHLLKAAAKSNKVTLSPQALTQFPDYAAKNPALLESFIVSKEVSAGVKPCDNPDEHAFWDHVHPSRVMHQILAKHALEFIDKVEST